MEIHYAGQLLPYTVLDKQPLVAPKEVVENKRLGALLSVIYAGQDERDQRRLASKKLTLRQKERLCNAGPSGPRAQCDSGPHPVWTRP